MAACTGKTPGSGLEAFGEGGRDKGATPAIKPLDTRLEGAYATDRISLPGFDDKQPAKGNHFVVLDVAVRNTDAQPRVFSEGRIIAADASRERSFPTPVNIFADGYLQLQVLPPSAGTRGKIVYEIPDDVSGVLYWVPGGDTRRILLHPDVMAVAGVATKSRASALSTAAQIPEQSAAPAPEGVQRATAPDGTRPAAPTVAITMPTRASLRGAEATVESEGARPGGRGSMVTPITTQSTAEVRMAGDQARGLACAALVSRNDPTEEARYLGFFRRECGAYPLPPAWAPARVVSAVRAPDPNRWPPRSGPAFDCEQAFSQAEHLICDDAVLSLMDWELTRAYANAQRSVDDPAALQREQDDWRWHVRNACTTVSCVESVYTERTADLTALARSQ